MKRERKSEGWDEPTNLLERGPNKVVERKKAQISEASQSLMQSHSKEIGKCEMICNDLQNNNDLHTTLNPGLSDLSSIMLEISQIQVTF